MKCHVAWVQLPIYLLTSKSITQSIYQSRYHFMLTWWSPSIKWSIHLSIVLYKECIIKVYNTLQAWRKHEFIPGIRDLKWSANFGPTHKLPFISITYNRTEAKPRNTCSHVQITVPKFFNFVSKFRIHLLENTLCLYMRHAKSFARASAKRINYIKSTTFHIHVARNLNWLITN